ncbi:MAG: hypothetical protein R3F34_14875 [Planctomycetota bacterium]
MRSRIAALVDGVELLLDRGEPRRARELLVRHPAEVAFDLGLARRLAWCELVAGDAVAASEVLAELGPDGHGVPLPLEAFARRARTGGGATSGAATSGAATSGAAMSADVVWARRRRVPR